MKTCTLKTLATMNLLALPLFGLTPSARAQVNYAISGNTAYVTNSPNASGNIVIASTYGGHPVTSISSAAFYYCSGLTSVTIPNSVASIGGQAFSECSVLKNVTIGDSVTNIGQGAFGYCSGLTNISVAATNLNYASPGGVLFNKAVTLLIQYPGGLNGSYTLPNSVTNIAQEALAGCSVLTNVTIGDSVTSIGLGAFNECSGLTSVTLPNSVTDIGQFAFSSCSSLTSVTLPNSVTSIGYNVFGQCSGLTNVTIPNSVTSIGDQAFNGCSSLTSVTLPNSVTNIGAAVFQECSALTSVTIPNSVTSIGQYAFNGCSSLTSVTIPDSVTSIGQQVFYACYALTNINVDAANSFYSSTNGVLFDKYQTMLIQFPGGLGGSYAIPDTVTNIGQDAFYGCGLTSVTIPNSVTSIGQDAFYACINLTSVTVPDSVTSIGSNAFGGCSSLANAIVGSGLTNLSYSYLFSSCGNLNSVTFLGNAPTADFTIFSGDNVSQITVYYTPGTTGWDTFASTVGVTVSLAFGSATYAGQPVIFYPPTGTTNMLQMSTNPASGNWVTVSNAVTLTALQLTNPPAAGFFRLQSSGGNPPAPGLALYFNLPVLFYPTNSAYSLWMATNLPVSSWSTPSGSAFISVEVTNAPPGAVFRLY